ncbi:TIGR01212 family radical SAM protein [Heliophilum fasciatum]|uniref:Radical SAM core domain-containing protein n=1 Tax=Heliophilum fasciatum TaxID=35700 RepID=A0A4R2RNU3_9FIRM|nr:TIGR01212 family radical SAM protein [Heliophilum fasciatum]MCW2278011.1 radical SAM protein (TIGR01212 family) [Heliophilum fasciatum]TCP64369.1 hypothetical protein EDD73_11068 [Heliophilum fasciatum]
MNQWGDKRYHSWNDHLRKHFGQKVVKVSLNAGLTCPNRDGTVGTGGCIFCCPQGSGACAGDPAESIRRQFAQIGAKLKSKWSTNLHIAYFQAFSNTYGDVDYLKGLYEEALAQPGVVGLAIATRPDCLPPDVLDLLAALNERTYLWVELGLQSAHDRTLAVINRGHDRACFEQALANLQARGIRTCAHMILGLPGESATEMMATGQYLAQAGIQGIKLHALHIMRDTRLAAMYRAQPWPLLTCDAYVDLVVRILAILPPDIVIQRLTGDAPRDLLVAPEWITRKWGVLQGIDQRLAALDTWQGKEAK